jgi:DNA topoisomerase IA
MDSKVKVFMVAEKASIARSIAEALAGRGKYIPRKGLINICPIMSWEGEFQGKKAEFHVLNNILSIKSTSVAGHIFNRDIPE